MKNYAFLNNCKVTETASGNVLFNCEDECWSFLVSEEIVESSDYEYKNKAYNLIYEWMLKHPAYCKINMTNYKWVFYRDDECLDNDALKPYHVNVSNLMKTYPLTFLDKVDRTLINLSLKFPNFGEEFFDEDEILDIRLTMSDNDKEYHLGLYHALVELRYLECAVGAYCYRITAKGWERIDELKKKLNVEKQGFIAMKFGKDTASIRETFKNAISKAGYAVSVIDEKEHNNQIVPEIFYEIEKSKFMVVDVTYPNYGAYYEAGYGQALGKEVIVCCRKDIFDSVDKPHFDIAQKSTVVWENEDDLFKRLVRRIEATVK